MRATAAAAKGLVNNKRIALLQCGRLAVATCHLILDTALAARADGNGIRIKVIEKNVLALNNAACAATRATTKSTFGD